MSELLEKWQKDCEYYYLMAGQSEGLKRYKFLHKAMTMRNCIKELKKVLQTTDGNGQSEQLTCPRCKSTNILSPDKDNDAQCIDCAFVWAG